MTQRTQHTMSIFKTSPVVCVVMVVLCGVLLLSVFFLVTIKHRRPPNLAMVVSVSSDGQYAVSSHLRGTIMVWDIARHTHTALSRSANIYSAYFIPDTHDVMWQDQHNIVHIQTVSGHELKTFALPFATYGEVITSNLKYYFASDWDWQLYDATLPSIHSPAPILHRLIYKTPHSMSFAGIGKLLNLTLSPNHQYLLVAGCGHRQKNVQAISLWATHTGQLQQLFPGNAWKTSATFSPDNQFIVSGDENGLGFVWHLKTGQLLFPLTPLFQVRIGRNRAQPPAGFGSNPAMLQVKFIDAQHFLRFTAHSRYVALYDIHHSWPIKYWLLPQHPNPSVEQYLRNAAIDTAPRAHILVMGQARHAGIVVYRYHPSTQRIQLIWAPRSD